MVWILKEHSSFEDMPSYGGSHYKQMIVRNGQFMGIFRHGFRPPCKCTGCAQQFRGDEQVRKIQAYTTGYPDEEAKEKVDGCRQSVFEDLHYLEQQCSLNGNSILKRWKKKTPEERKQLLLKVDPKMYPHDWCEFRFAIMYQKFLNRPETAPEEPFDISPGMVRRPHRHVCMLPYVNLQDLANDPLRFLNLLYNRVKYSPAQWAPYDNFLLAEQWRLGSFETSYNGNSIVIDGDDYGQYKVWTANAAHEGTVIGFPRGILLLEAQQYLMRLLRGVVDTLLEGIVREDATHQCNNFTKALQYGLKRRDDKEGNCASKEFASIYLNQPFSAPPAFDIQTLLSTAQAQLNLHADHLWLLQTEPSYMRRHAALIVAGGVGDNLTRANQMVHTTSHLMKDAIRFWSWQWIMEEVQTLQKAQLKFGIFSPGNTLPAEYTRAITSLEALLRFLLRFFALEIQGVLPHRPGFQSKWKETFDQNLQSAVTFNQRADQISSSELFNTDRLDFCLSMLVDHSHDEKIFDTVAREGYAKIFALLDEHLTSMSRKGNKGELARLDEVLYTMYTDLSTLSQMLIMVSFHRPHVPERSSEEVKKFVTSKGWRYIKNTFIDQILATWLCPSADGTKYEHYFDVDVEKLEKGPLKIKAEQHLASLLKNFIDSSQRMGSRHTQAWLDQDEAQRQALSRFWEGMRDRHAGTLRRLQFGAEDIEADLKILSADSSPDHLQSLRSQRDEILAKIVVKIASVSVEKGAKNLDKVPVAIQTQWGAEKQKIKTKTEPKAKVKTRATTENGESSTNSASEIVEADKPEPLRATVSRGAFSIFQAMFPSPGNEDRTRVVKWNAFVNALAEGELGFVARQNTGGSAYIFEPTEISKWKGMGKIIFHKPHPTPELDSIMLLINGKRMSKWFGWSKETFVLK